MRNKEFGENVSPMCRFWSENIVSECPKLVQNEYKKTRHDKLARVIHWQLCEKTGN